jgi:hypothetical protein
MRIVGVILKSKYLNNSRIKRKIFSNSTKISQIRTIFKITESRINFFNWESGDGVQLGLLGIAVTNRPIVPASDHYDDGEFGGMIGRGNRSARRKPAPVPLCPPQTPHACPDANPGRRGGKPATNCFSRFSYGTTSLEWKLLHFSKQCIPCESCSMYRILKLNGLY